MSKKGRSCKGPSTNLFQERKRKWLNGRTRHQRTRGVKGIDQNKALNRAIWSLTEKKAELKGESLAA